MVDKNAAFQELNSPSYACAPPNSLRELKAKGDFM